ncbi:enolase C-terminal domain-like protein [Ramlibacter sp. AN1015]|uniref:mandelate racemase/muconate lactonizing enzyme family protein n=1 Tax=Ramlibacter sp. AN1015 TaxID=3133428 RepID=UPI0030BEA816
MQIACVQLYPLEVPMDRPIRMAGETLTHAHTLLARVIDESGREGWGEASAAPLMTGETLESIAASAHYLAGRMAGQDIAGPADIAPRFDAILYGNPSARSCLETALMDLLAQRAGLPLHRMLRAGETRGRVERLEMLHMLASGELEGELAEAQRLRAQGFRQWKIKVGAGDLASDLRRVKALSQALAGDVVSADANQMLAFDAALAIAREGGASGLVFLEQPLRAGRLADMAELHRLSGMPLCADESIQDAGDIQAHHAAGAAQGASLKLIKLGGVQALTEAGRLCLAQGMRVNLACKVAETTISAAATAHVGFALGEVAWGFSMSNRYLAEDVCSVPLAPREGAVFIDQVERPGLGFAPDAQRLRGFASASLPVRELRG